MWDLLGEVKAVQLLQEVRSRGAGGVIEIDVDVAQYDQVGSGCAEGWLVKLSILLTSSIGMSQIFRGHITYWYSVCW